MTIFTYSIINVQIKKKKVNLKSKMHRVFKMFFTSMDILSYWIIDTKIFNNKMTTLDLPTT